MTTDSTHATLDAVHAHLKAFLARDIPAMLAHYPEDVVAIGPTGPIVGKAAMGPFLEHYMANLNPDVIKHFEIVRLDAHGNLAHLIWKAADVIPFASATYLVHDGKIAREGWSSYQP